MKSLSLTNLLPIYVPTKNIKFLKEQKEILNNIFIDPKLIVDILLVKSSGTYGQILEDEHIKLDKMVNDLRLTKKEYIYSYPNDMTSYFYNLSIERGSSLNNYIEKLLKEPTKKNALDLLRYIAISFKYFINDKWSNNPFEEEEKKFILNIWPSIKKTFLFLGYEFHYFNFFNMNNESVNLFWNNVKFDNLQKEADFKYGYDIPKEIQTFLQQQSQFVAHITPQTFESQTSLFDSSISRDILNKIENGNSISYHSNRSFFDFKIKKSLDLIGWRKRDLRDAIEATQYPKRNRTV